MNKKMMIIVGAALALVIFVVILVVNIAKSMSVKPSKQAASQDEIDLTLPTADSSILVNATSSKTKDNTVVLTASGLAGKVSLVAYEMTYESGGLVKGVNSGSKPIETMGKDSFEREVYLGTCSKNVCKPDGGVNKISVVMEFTDGNGKKSQFSKDFPL
ncbi:hypothetical protein HY947_02755 [Candidatus Gottesmanbacteria bacterium]|nr:hypothetical protein [Candidatus Gottesmanbacteria bacterium]